MKKTLILFLISFNSLLLLGQSPVNLSIVHDGHGTTKDFISLVKEEVDVLLSQQYTINYNFINANDQNISPSEAVNSAISDESDILLTLGFSSSGALDAIGEYSKPCISGISLQRLDTDSTGINNYTMIQSPFSIGQDFNVFRSIYPFKYLGVFIRPEIQEQLENYIRNFANDFQIQFVPISDNPEFDLNSLNPDVDAIYYLPNLHEKLTDQKTLINGINERKLPSFSLIGRDDVEQGILASISPSDYIDIYARRIALNIMKIVEGQNPKDLSIRIDGIENDFVINVETMEKLEIYPPFEVLSQASLINLETRTGKQYNLHSAVAQALSNNLNIQAAQRDVSAQKAEIGIAKSNLLPNLNATTSLVTLDGSTADLLKATNQLTPQTAFSGNLELTQLIYSQPAWANVAIQKALLQSNEAGLLSKQLDLVLDVSTSYLQYLQAKANLTIQNTNVQTTLSNLKIAKTKAKIGAVSNADVYGFESQLALNKSALNDAQTRLEQAQLRFNQLLNLDLEEDVVLDDVHMGSGLLFIQDDRIFNTISNQYDFRKFASFLIESALKNAPEIDQLKWAIIAQENSLSSNKQSRYMPQIAMRGSLDKTLGRYGTRALDKAFIQQGIDPYKPTWNIGINASLPIFQGGLRNKKIQKDKILLEQLGLNRAALEQQFATNIRLSLENLGNSYNDIQFTQQAELSSGKYLGVIQNLYREGVTTIVTLLDAQNNALSSQLGAVSSRYQFIIDAITIERLINNIYLLATPKEKEIFVNDYLNFLISNNEE